MSFLLTVGDETVAECWKPTTAATTPTVPSLSPASSGTHPLLNEILARNLPAKSRTVQHAWTHTLMSTQTENATVWLQNLYQATLEASAVPELVINSRVCVASYFIVKHANPVWSARPNHSRGSFPAGLLQVLRPDRRRCAIPCESRLAHGTSHRTERQLK